MKTVDRGDTASNCAVHVCAAELYFHIVQT